MVRRKGMGSVRRLESGNWQLRFAVDGKAKSVTIAAKNEAAANKELRRILHELDTGDYCGPSRKLVGDYLHEWIAGRKAAVAGGTLRESAYESYAELIDRHIIPHLGRKRLTELTALDVKRFYDILAMTPSKRRPGKFLAPKTRRVVHTVLNQALAEAERFDLIGRNPISKLARKDIPTDQEPEGVPEPLTQAETDALLRAASGHWLEIPIVLKVATGMRRGEILGLPWAHLDLGQGIVQVRQQLVYTGGECRLTPTKTRKDRRDIDLPAFALEHLRRHQREQAPPSIFVVAHPRHPDRLSHAFTEFCKEHGVRRVRLHDLRHGHASHLHDAGHSLKEISERLGHANIAITANIYCHLSKEKRQEAAGTLDRLFGRPEDDARRA